ncbi:MAG: peptide deformylase [Lysobacterales bacterium]|jgi:peptide deformylase
MAIRQVLRIGNPLLRQVSLPVRTFNSDELHSLITDMRETMVAADGAGLAAPQVGVARRVMIFGITNNPRYPDAEPVPETILINPEFEVLGESIETGWEGCLSVPGMRGRVTRPAHIRYKGFDLQGNSIVCEAIGFHARVFQHEYDHLDGILYVDRLDDPIHFGFVDELYADEQLNN